MGRSRHDMNVRPTKSNLAHPDKPLSGQASGRRSGLIVIKNTVAVREPNGYRYLREMEQTSCRAERQTAVRAWMHK